MDGNIWIFALPHTPRNPVARIPPPQALTGVSLRHDRSNLQPYAAVLVPMRSDQFPFQLDGATSLGLAIVTHDF